MKQKENINRMLKTLSIALLAAIAFGLTLTPLETTIVKKEKTLDLLPPPPPPGATDQLEQQLSIITLGGLRSLIAAILNIEAFDHFRQKNWTNLERRYRQIVSLAPHTEYYWDIGSWHLAYNAASDLKQDKKRNSEERIKAHRDYIARGKTFLKQGIENNPRDWTLQTKLANLLSDPLRHPDYEAAAEAYRKSRELGAPNITARQEFYTRARIPSQTHRAWKLGKELLKNPDNRQPSLVTTLYALQNKLNLPETERIPFRELFPTDKIAINHLRLQLSNRLEYPIDGIRAKLDELIETTKRNTPPRKKTPPPLTLLGRHPAIIKTKNQLHEQNRHHQ